MAAKATRTTVSTSTPTKPAGVGLALGGGAVRGVAHLGVIDVLLEADIPIAAVAGTSVGALVGAVFATRSPWPGAEALAHQIESCSLDAVSRVQLPPGRASAAARLLRWLRLGKAALRGAIRDAAFSGQALEAFVRPLLGELRFEDTHTPLFITATDIDSGACVILDEGPLATAVRASSAIPGIFPPVHWAGKRLVDGATARLIPVEVLRPHAAVIVGVDVSDARIATHPTSAYTIAWQAGHISIRHLRRYGLAQADVMICANAREPVLGFDFTRIDELIELGRDAARAALPRIQELLEGTEVRPERPRRRRLWRGFRPDQVQPG